MTFYGWSSFRGITHAPGTHLVPDEDNPADQINGWDPPGLPYPPSEGTTDWNGRRPPAHTLLYRGDGGSFRFSPSEYNASIHGLLFGFLHQGQPWGFEGMAASFPLNGFWQDENPDLEVFRGSFVADTAGSHELLFELVDAAYFNDPTHSRTQIGVSHEITEIAATYSVTPAPASLALIGLGGLARRCR